MPLVETTYTLLPNNLLGDTTRGTLASANDPLNALGLLGIIPSGFNSMVLRYELDIPSGAIISAVKFRARRLAKTAFASLAYRFGILVKDGAWDALDFGVPSYPLQSDLPAATNAGLAINPGVLFNDQMVTPSRIILSGDPAAVVETVGEGYAGLDHDFVDLVSLLQAWIDSAAYDPDGTTSDKAIGWAFDYADTSGVGSQFSMFYAADGHVGERGVELTIKYDPGLPPADGDVTSARMDAAATVGATLEHGAVSRDMGVGAEQGILEVE